MSRRNRKRSAAGKNGAAHTNGAGAGLIEPVDDAVLRSMNQSAQAVERAVQKASRQDRDPLGSAAFDFWHSTLNWVRKMDQMPAFDDCYKVDAWCIERMLEEPYLAGFFGKAISAQANRGWSLYGGKRITENTARMFHRFDPTTVRLADGRVYIDDLKSAGWRRASQRKAFSRMARNGGAFVELQYRLEPRFTRSGWNLTQVINMYNMDTSKVEWTGNSLYPIRYDGSEEWPDPAFYQLVAMPLDRQDKYHIGLSPLYRCIRLAILMTEVADWELGTLSDDFVDSLLLLNGADGMEFNKAMKEREIVTTAGKNKAKRSAVLGNLEPDITLTGELLRLRSMPESLTNFEDRIYLLLQGYAVNMGYSLGTFMESPFGSLLGRSGAEVGFLQKATNEAGGNDYHVDDEEQINNLAVPAGVEFHYDEQESDDRAKAEIDSIRAGMLTELFLAQRSDGSALGTAEQFQQLGIEWDLFDPEWTVAPEEVATDHDDQTRVIESVAVQRFIHNVEAGYWNDDAIVRYHYDPVSQRATGETIVPSVARMLDERQRFFIMSAGAVERATDEEKGSALKLMRKQLGEAQDVAKVVENA